MLCSTLCMHMDHLFQSISVQHGEIHGFQVAPPLLLIHAEHADPSLALSCWLTGWGLVAGGGGGSWVLSPGYQVFLQYTSLQAGYCCNYRLMKHCSVCLFPLSGPWKSSISGVVPIHQAYSYTRWDCWGSRKYNVFLMVHNWLQQIPFYQSKICNIQISRVATYFL